MTYIANLLRDIAASFAWFLYMRQERRWLERGGCPDQSPEF